MAHTKLKLTEQNVRTQNRSRGRKPQINVKRLHGSESYFPIPWAHCPANFNSTFSQYHTDGSLSNNIVIPLSTRVQVLSN